ncbi:MAG: hypothetical protein QOK36_1886, partial [Gaiellales bacterium]|nr:hypothetical protein [Gaiellales bacterium]
PPPPTLVEAVDNAYKMPDVVKGGVVAMRFRNAGKELHEFAFGRVDKGHTFAQALRAFEQHKEVTWTHDLGGPGLLTPGAEITITRALPPGTYFFLDGVPNTKGISHEKLGMRRAITITGNSGARLPRADAVITAEKTHFAIPSLHAGLETIELRNRAGSGRGFMLSTLNAGKTRADIERWAKAIESTGRLPGTSAPATFLGAMQTIPSGTSVFLTINLEAGRRYHLSDDESGIQADFTPR